MGPNKALFRSDSASSGSQIGTPPGSHQVLKSLDAYRMQLNSIPIHSRPALPQALPRWHQVDSRVVFGRTSSWGQQRWVESCRRGSRASAVRLGAGAYPSPSSSLYNTPAGPTREQAVIAALASQTLLGKLGQSFWDVFSGSSSASSLTHLTPTSTTMDKQ